jgi:hypothetical protein
MVLDWGPPFHLPRPLPFATEQVPADVVKAKMEAFDDDERANVTAALQAQ